MAISSENLAGVPLDPAGIGPALGALDVEGRLAPEAAQDDLFASSPLFAGREEGGLKPVRGTGRPAGSLNRTTEEWRAFWLASYRSPLLFLGDIISADPFKLAEEIRKADRKAGVDRDVSVLDVIQLQRGAAADIAPYVHRKQPIALDLGNDKQNPVIVFNTLDAASLGAFWAQAAEKTEESALVPVVLEGEVAAEKSQGDGEAGASA